MNSRISDARWLPPLRLAVFLGLAAVFATGTFAAPAYADIHPNGKGNDAPRAPARQQVADRDHGWGGHRHYEQRGVGVGGGGGGGVGGGSRFFCVVSQYRFCGLNSLARFIVTRIPLLVNINDLFRRKNSVIQILRPCHHAHNQPICPV